MLPYVQHHLFSWQQAAVGRKADQRGSAQSQRTLFWFQSHFPIQSVQTPKTVAPAFSVQQTLFCPDFKRLSFLHQMYYSEALTALILFSIPACHLHLTLDSPHCRTPSKHLGMYGKCSFLECHWQSLPANKGTGRQSQVFTKLKTNLTAFSITRRSSLFSVAFNCGLCVSEWK